MPISPNLTNAIQASQAATRIGKALIGALTGAAAISGAGGLSMARRSRRGRPRKRRVSRDSNRDRTFNAPVSRGRVLSASRPISVRIRHREFVQDVETVANADSISRVAINPGSENAFPWLSQIAGAFEKYRVNSLSFEFVTATSTATTGAIALAPDYDPDDIDVIIDKQHLLMFQDVVRGPLWASLKCNLPSIPRQLYYTRGPSDSWEQLKFHDPAQLIILVSEPSVSGTVGEIWVNYDITLSIPEFEPSIDDTAGFIVDSTTLAVVQSIFPNYRTNAALFSSYHNGLGLALDDINNRGFHIWQAGEYTINLLVKGTGITARPLLDATIKNMGQESITFRDVSLNAAGTRCYAVFTLIVAARSFTGVVRSPKNSLYVYTYPDYATATSVTGVEFGISRVK